MLLWLNSCSFSDCDHITYMARMSSAEFRSYQNYFALLISWKVIYFYSIQYFSPKAFSTPSSCDSRNLNLSPFCNTSSTSLAMWQPSVLETYGEEGKLDYLDRIAGPMRKKYPNSMVEREIITSLTEVTIQILFSDDIISPSNTEEIILYIPFPRQAVLKVIINFQMSGRDVLQCLWERYCYCEHLLRRLNSVW